MRKSSIYLVVILACYFCIAHTAIAVSISIFVVSIFLLLMAYCYFEHALFFRGWRTATTGKRRTPPGQAVAAGTVMLIIAASLGYASIRMILWSLR